jgi:23S rRNA pseudouridine1911/1915/1917 synthase
VNVVAEWTVTDPGQRLDRLIAEELDCSRSRARSLLAHGAVEVDGRRAVDKGILLEPGQVVRVLESPEFFDRLRPVDEAVEVLGEGAGWIAVNKPAGLPVHPLRHDETDTLLQRLVTRNPEIEGIGEGGLRSGVVHRLDVDTSGVQIFALDEQAFSRFREAFSGHRIDKLYRALVRGVPDDHGVLELDLEITRHRPAKVSAVAAGEGSANSRLCPLRWRLREPFADASLVELRPRTGFLHQIRVSMAWLGHPLLGDGLYGDSGDAAGRHMLHASRIALGEIEVEAPDPADFSDLLQQLRS